MGQTPIYKLPWPEMNTPADMDQAVRPLAQATEAALQTIAAVPTGVILSFGGTAAPTGWLLCDGAAINRTTFAALFGVIGTVYGAGDGSTTFNVPNLRGRVAAGLDAGQTEFNARGKTGGEKAHVLALGELAAHDHGGGVHAHSIYDPSHGHGLSDPTHAHGMGGESVDHSHQFPNWALTDENTGVVWTRIQLNSGGTMLYKLNSTVGRNQGHTHGISGAGTGMGVNGASTGIGIYNSAAVVSPQGSGTAHQNLPPYVVTEHIIKA